MRPRGESYRDAWSSENVPRCNPNVVLLTPGAKQLADVKSSARLGRNVDHEISKRSRTPPTENETHWAEHTLDSCQRNGSLGSKQASLLNVQDTLGKFKTCNSSVFFCRF